MSTDQQLRPGDVVTLSGLGRGATFGRVFDVIGDVVRVWWTNADRDVDVEELAACKPRELAFVDRPEAYACVRFVGANGVAPYAFVVTGWRSRVSSAVVIFSAAPDYEVVHTNTNEDKEMNDGNRKAGGDLGD